MKEFLTPLRRKIFARRTKTSVVVHGHNGNGVVPTEGTSSTNDDEGLFDHLEESQSADWDRATYSRQIKEILFALVDNRSKDHAPRKIVMGSIDCDYAATAVIEGLSVACATNGLRVLLVDANFKAPRLHEDFGVENDLGMSTLLNSSDPPHRMVKETEFSTLDLLASGPPSPEVSSSLARQQLLHRLQPVAPRYDFLFVDAGTLEPYHLGQIAIGCDHLVLAVQEHVAPMRALERACEFLRGERVPDPSILIVE